MNHDITNFMTWFINQVITIVSSTFSILDSIQFAGTSILRVLLVILFFSAVIPVIMTIANAGVTTADRVIATRRSTEDRNARREYYRSKKGS